MRSLRRPSRALQQRPGAHTNQQPRTLGDGAALCEQWRSTRQATCRDSWPRASHRLRGSAWQRRRRRGTRAQVRPARAGACAAPGRAPAALALQRGCEHERDGRVAGRQVGVAQQPGHPARDAAQRVAPLRVHAVLLVLACAAPPGQGQRSRACAACAASRRCPHVLALRWRPRRLTPAQGAQRSGDRPQPGPPRAERARRVRRAASPSSSRRGSVGGRHGKASACSGRSRTTVGPGRRAVRGRALGAAWQHSQRPRKMKRRSQLSGACCSGQALYQSSRFTLARRRRSPHGTHRREQIARFCALPGIPEQAYAHSAAAASQLRPSRRWMRQEVRGVSQMATAPCRHARSPAPSLHAHATQACRPLQTSQQTTHPVGSRAGGMHDVTEVCASAQAHARRRAPSARAGAGGRGRAHSVSASRPQVRRTRIMTSFLGFHSRPVAGMRQRTSVPNTTYVPNAARARAPRSARRLRQARGGMRRR